MLREFGRYLMGRYDKVTRQIVEISIGDLLLSVQEPTVFQFTTASRMLDVENYLDNGDSTFPYQMMISNHRYGKDYNHLPSQGVFKRLVDSFKDKGYDSNSLFTVDCEMKLIDGTHRMALCFVLGISQIKVEVLKRHIKFAPLDKMYEDPEMPTKELQKVYNKWLSVQAELTKRGITFCAIAEGSDLEECQNFVEDLKPFVDIRKVDYTNRKLGGAIYCAFALYNPDYHIVDKKLSSKSIERIESILLHRYHNSGIAFRISRNCTEGLNLSKQFLVMKSEENAK